MIPFFPTHRRRRRYPAMTHVQVGDGRFSEFRADIMLDVVRFMKELVNHIFMVCEEGHRDYLNGFRQRLEKPITYRELESLCIKLWAIEQGLHRRGKPDIRLRRITMKRELIHQLMKKAKDAVE